MKPIQGTVIVTLMAALLQVGAIASASSHREAPSILDNPEEDNTDVYTFLDPTDPNKIVFVANYVPFAVPTSGPNFYRFNPDARYDIRIDNNGDAVADIIFEFDFRTEVRNPDTFLYNTGVVESLTDEDLNVRQFYTLTRIDVASGTRTVLGTDLPVAPWYVGDRSFPPPTYSNVAESAVQNVGDDLVFAGPRDDPFFVDLGIFDLFGVSGDRTLAGFNVMSMVISVGIDDVAAGGTRPAADATGPETVLGVYAASSLPQVRILRDTREPDHLGPFRQVSRLGVPLVNEVLIPLRDKDNYLRTRPVNDVANFGEYILNPLLPPLLNAVLDLGCAPTPAGGRMDLVALLSPNMTEPADLIRIDIREGQTFEDVGFPNGRRLTDDVVDILLTALCNSGMPVSDGVPNNDRDFQSDFPFLALPFSGNPDF